MTIRLTQRVSPCKVMDSATQLLPIWETAAPPNSHERFCPKKETWMTYDDSNIRYLHPNYDFALLKENLCPVNCQQFPAQ